METRRNAEKDSIGCKKRRGSLLQKIMRFLRGDSDSGGRKGDFFKSRKNERQMGIQSDGDL
jgi:hypothetical protein